MSNSNFHECWIKLYNNLHCVQLVSNIVVIEFVQPRFGDNSSTLLIMNFGDKRDLNKKDIP